MEKHEKTLLKQAMRFLAADKRPRAMRRILEAVSHDEVTWQGCSFEVFPHDNYSDRIFWIKEVPDEVRTILTLLNIIRDEDTLFLDVGGNTGIFSVLAAHHAATSSDIIAFEPHPHMLERLGRNVALNKLESRVQIERCALSAEDGTAQLHVFDGNYGRSTLQDRGDVAEAATIDVPTRKITDFITADAASRLCVIKIDVEGFEDHVLLPLLDAPDLLACVDHIVVEVVLKKNWGYDVIAALESHGFKAKAPFEGNVFLSRG